MGINSGLPNILFNSVQKSILKILYMNPDSSYYTNEIIKRTKSGTGAVQRELAKLTSAQIIQVKKLGNQKHYQANKDLPYYSELRSIIIKSFGLFEILHQSLISLSDKNIRFAFVYGSFAKQTDTIRSDIDLLLIGEDLAYSDIFHHLQDAEEKLGRKINPSIYSVKEWIRKYKENNNFVKNIVEQPKIFLLGDENELKAIR